MDLRTRIWSILKLVVFAAIVEGKSVIGLPYLIKHMDLLFGDVKVYSLLCLQWSEYQKGLLKFTCTDSHSKVTWEVQRHDGWYNNVGYHSRGAVGKFLRFVSNKYFKYFIVDAMIA